MSITTGAGTSVSLGEVVPSQSLRNDMRAMFETAISASALRCACSEQRCAVRRSPLCMHIYLSNVVALRQAHVAECT